MVTYKDIKIFDRLKSDVQAVTDRGYNVAFVVLYGSQNYHVDTPQSDIDTRAVVIPSFDDLIDKRTIADTVKMENGNCTVTDIRVWARSLTKCHFNFLETLFTPYYTLGEHINYYDLVRLCRLRENIARACKPSAIRGFKGAIDNALHRLERGGTLKDVADAMRLNEMMQRYIDGESYATILTPRDPNKYVLLKMGICDFEIDYDDFIREMRTSSREIADTAIARLEQSGSCDDVVVTTAVADWVNEVLRIEIKHELNKT